MRIVVSGDADRDLTILPRLFVILREAPRWTVFRDGSWRRPKDLAGMTVNQALCRCIRPHDGRKKILRSRAGDCASYGSARRSLRMTIAREAGNILPG
jgi:hypothetical protein